MLILIAPLFVFLIEKREGFLNISLPLVLILIHSLYEGDDKEKQQKQNKANSYEVPCGHNVKVFFLVHRLQSKKKKKKKSI